MKSRRTFGHALGLGLACLCLANPAPVRAEEVAEPRESAKSKSSVPTAIEEITVTARKREESLQSTPISITAFSEQDLKNLDARKMEDIADSVPNLGFDRATSTASSARIRIRGVGNGDPIVSADPGVGVYVDGIYMARAQGAIVTVSDIERVEVLRGPQGTLFGKNTIGGAVNITTKKPDVSEMAGYGEARIGNYDRFDTRFGINVPLVPERAAARFSFATATRDGFQTNKSTGPDRMGDDKMLAGRAQFLVLPSENTELLMAFDHSRENRTPRGAKCKVTNRTPFGSLGAPAFAGFNLQSGALTRCAEDDQRDTYSVATNLSFAQDNLRTYGASSTFSWDVSDELTFKSLTGWRRQDNSFAFDLDGGPTSTFHFNSLDAGKSGGDQLSQEFQLIGKALGDRLTYVAGLYGFTEKDQERTYLAGDPSFLLSIPPFIINQPLALRIQRLKINNSSYAAFVQGTYDIDDQWSLDLGLRRTEESKRADRTERVGRTGIFPNPVTGTVTFAAASSQPVPGISFERSSRSDDWSPLARLNYQITDEASTYVTWTRGFKSGGFNGRGDRPINQNLIDDEKLTSYETGFKSQWMQNRLRFNASAFYNIYEDIQLTIPTATGGSLAIVVQNAGEALVRGAEFEMMVLPMADLQLTSSIGITNAKYTEFDDAADPTKVDNQLPGVPTYSMNFGAQYGWDLGDRGNLTALANWTHIGRSGTDVDDSRILRQGKRGELDSQLVWALADGKTEFSLWGNNLLGREYLDNGINFASSFGHAVLYYNDPRTYGLEVRRTF